MLWLASSYGFRSMATVPVVTVGNTVVQPADGARNMGCYFDRNLNMKQHITNVCRLCYFQLRQLRVIRRTLPADVLKTLLHAFVSSRLDYCNSLFYGLPQCEIQKLQRVQNAAARLFGGWENMTTFRQYCEINFIGSRYNSVLNIKLMQKLLRSSKLSCSKPLITLLKQQISNCCTVKKSHRAMRIAFRLLST